MAWLMAHHVNYGAWATLDSTPRFSGASGGYTSQPMSFSALGSCVDFNEENLLED